MPAPLPRVHLRPALREQAERLGDLRLALVVAAWMRFLRGVSDAGVAHEVNDPLGGPLQAAALNVEGEADDEMRRREGGAVGRPRQQAEARTRKVDLPGDRPGSLAQASSGGRRHEAPGQWRGAPGRQGNRSRGALP